MTRILKWRDFTTEGGFMAPVENPVKAAGSRGSGPPWTGAPRLPGHAAC